MVGCHRLRPRKNLTSSPGSVDHYTPLFSARPQGSTAKDFTDLVEIYEAAIEPLARLCAVLGRWGAAAEHTIVLDAIKGLHAASQVEQSGWVAGLALKSYPVALVSYAYGMGLVRANRLGELNELFNTTLINRREMPFPLGVDLSPFYVEGANGLFELWKSFEDQSRALTPLCNRLHDLLTPKWAPDFAGLHDHGLLYERFEFLSFLFFCEQRGISEESLADAVKNHGFRKIALGRISWHSETIHRFAHEYATEEYKTPVIAAGFALGSESYLELMLDGLKRLSRY